MIWFQKSFHIIRKQLKTWGSKFYLPFPGVGCSIVSSDHPRIVHKMVKRRLSTNQPFGEQVNMWTESTFVRSLPKIYDSLCWCISWKLTDAGEKRHKPNHVGTVIQLAFNHLYQFKIGRPSKSIGQLLRYLPIQYPQSMWVIPYHMYCG